MKKIVLKKNLRRFLIFLLLNSISFPGVFAQWHQDEFIIGTLVDPSIIITNNNISNTYIKNVQLAKDAYFNLFTDTHNEKVEGEDYLKMLTINDSLGIHTFYRVWYSTSSYNAKFNSISAYNIDTANVYAWYLKDEPALTESGDLVKLVQYFKKLTPNKISYINLLPIYGFKTKEEYEAYLDAYLIDTSVLQIVSYDFYPFHTSFFQSNYYTNLQLITEKAKNRPVWIYPLTVQHATYIDPGRYHLYFMVFSPLAYGVKGIIYYTYETILYSIHYTYGNAIIDTLGNPTAKYYIVKDINRFVSKIAGPIIMNSTRIGTYHVSDAPFNNEEIDPRYLLNDTTPLISTISNTNIVTGLFRSDEDTTLYYLFMHNKRDQNFNNVFISLKGNHVGDIEVSAPVQDFSESTEPFFPLETSYDSIDNETELRISFTPGELRILKVRNIYTLPTKKSQYRFNMSIAPNPVKDEMEVRFFLEKDEKVTLYVYNIGGHISQKILSSAFLNKGKQVQYFNVSSLSPGLYLLYVWSESGKGTCRFVKV